MSKQEDPATDIDDGDAAFEPGMDAFDDDDLVEADDIEVLDTDLKVNRVERSETSPKKPKSASKRLDERAEEAWLREQLEDWDDWDLGH